MTGIRRRERILFALVFCLAALLRLLSLSRNGIGSPYFAATALSMSQDWRLFFYNGFDPGGFVSVDKPPLAYWMTALSARLFGFSPLSQLVPQALAGLITIFVLWRSVRRSHGALAGLLAALFLALTPIAVAVDRSNMVDSWLTLFLTLAVCAALRKKYVLSSLWVGLAFLTKLLAGLFVLPALFAAWLLGKREGWTLALSALVLISVGASWPLAVDRTPKENRPYVGGSKDDSVRDLIFGYNGLGRVLGRSDQTAPEMKLPPLIYGGTPGPGRLFEPRLGDGWAWLLPLVTVGAISLFRARRWNSLALWGGWLVVVAALFSGAKGTFHVHYLDTLTPPAAALAGIGSAWGIRSVRRGGRASLFGALFLLLAVVWESVVLARGANAGWQRGLGLPLWGLAAVGIGYLLLAWLREAPLSRAYGLLSVLLLTLAPLAWCGVTLTVGNVSMAPFAGPKLLDPREPLGIDQPFGPKFIDFLKSHRGGAKYLVAVGSARQAAPLILATRLPVMSMGGFLGTDPILTPEKLAGLAAKGQVRYALVDGDTQPATSAWIRAHGRAVPVNLWRSGDRRYQETYYLLWDLKPL